MTADEQTEIQALRELVEKLTKELEELRAQPVGRVPYVTTMTTGIWDDCETGV